MTLGQKVEDCDFAHFFEDGTKGKVPSKIKPPLLKNFTVKKCKFQCY